MTERAEAPAAPARPAAEEEWMATGEVRAELGGRAGKVVYTEGEGALTFWWEYSGPGVSIVVPTATEWDAECRRQNAPWARGRRDEILEVVAREAPRQYAPTARVERTDDSIELVFAARS